MDSRIKVLVSLPEKLVLETDLNLPVDYLRNKPKQGARSHLIERLLREWLDSLARSPRASYNDDPETKEDSQ